MIKQNNINENNSNNKKYRELRDTYFSCQLSILKAFGAGGVIMILSFMHIILELRLLHIQKSSALWFDL